MTQSKIYGFHNFAEVPVSHNGAFRDNIRQFLLQCAEPEDYDLDGIKVWCTHLVYENRGTVLPLYTVEENVKHSNTPVCDYCRSAGWSHHFVSKRKYHLIIPRNDEWNNPLDEGAFDLQTHLLHGLIHSNGYGHLICINGMEGGSEFIWGTEIMDLWDRICTALHARQVSVEDLSSKRKMDLRLLHGVAYGYSWFGRWGYRFSHGSFGVKEHNYEIALDFLSSFDLDKIIEDLSITNGCSYIKKMIHHYRTMSHTKLVSIRDLLRFIFCQKNSSTPITQSPIFFSNCVVGKEKTAKSRKLSDLAAESDGRWPVKRLEHVAEIIVEALKEKREMNKASSSGMTRQEVRDAARLHIGDTGLIDYVLKVMNNVIVGNIIVRRAVNRCTKVLEFTIQDVDSSKESFCKKVPGAIQALTISPGQSLYNDVNYLYTNVLLGYPESDSVSLAIKVILHSKHFVKEWPFGDSDDEFLRFTFGLTTTSCINLSDDVSRGFPPRDIIILPLSATLGNVKVAVQNAMRDTYCAAENLIVTEIIGMEGVQDEEVIFGLIESGQEIWARGCGLDLESDLRYHGGTLNSAVRCKCGAGEDDGERMVACNICETCQHTRCSGIEEAEAVPKLFVCDACCSSLAPVQSHCGFTYSCDSYDTSMLLPEVDMDLLY